MSINWFAGINAAPQVKAPQRQAQAQGAAQEALATAASAQKDNIQLGGTYTVRKCDSLWGISQKVLGDPNRWPEIYALNKHKISDPDLIFPGTTLKIPAAKTQKPAEKPATQKPATQKPVTQKPAEPQKPVTPAVQTPAAPAEQKPVEPAQPMA